MKNNFNARKDKNRIYFFLSFFFLFFFFIIRDQYIKNKFEGPIEHIGLCDGSAGVGLGADQFIVGEDEENQLRFYHSDQVESEGQTAVHKQVMNGYLNNLATLEKAETDIEGATKAGDYIFWITSHGRNKKGKIKKKRHRFFATKLSKVGTFFKVKTVGVPYKTLITDLIADDTLKTFKITPTKTVSQIILETTQLKGKKNKKKSTLAPKIDGLNIEGLSSQPDGSILIAFRNPRPGPDGEALLIPFKNPLAVVMNQQKPRFGKPVLLPLGEKGERLGFRGIEYSPAHNSHIIIAGSHDNEGLFKLYKWSGSENDPPVFIQKIENVNPESVIVYDNTKYVKLLSDDGNRDIEVNSDKKPERETKTPCKNLPSFERKKFRSLWVYVK